MKTPNLIDKHVGSRLRMRRMMLGMSQEKLAVGFGLTFQQVQKYEKGVNRMGASRLQQAAQILDVSVPFFFEGAPGGHKVGGDAPSRTPREKFEIRTRIKPFDSLARFFRFCAVLQDRSHDQLANILGHAFGRTFRRQQTKLRVGAAVVAHAHEESFAIGIRLGPNKPCGLILEAPCLDDFARTV
jgi:transcriptional regulator with XRE-family HTH domain